LVQLCQAHFVATRAKEFCRGQDDIPVVLCGDFNSQPRSFVHRYLTGGEVNAKSVAPWYAASIEHEQRKIENTANEHGSNEILASELSLRKITTSNSTSKATEHLESSPTLGGAPEVRYILDNTLSRFCRCLRILGINAAIETEEEEIERTKQGRM
jgi:hypothetical protein